MSVEEILKQAGVTKQEIDAVVKHVLDTACLQCIQELMRVQYSFERIRKHVAETAR